MRRTVRATRYVTPLREGGSLPGIVEADDDGTYVVKFRGAGQGTASLVAEVVVGELGRLLGIRVPELVGVDLDPEIGRREPDEEVQDLLAASAGLNLGMDFLPGSVGYDGLGWTPPVTEALAVHWLDAFTANVDRTWRNPNLLVWHRALWAIDHGAALVFQHAWPDVDRWAARPYDLAQHVLGPVVAQASRAQAADADAHLAGLVTADTLGEVLALVPDAWLLGMNAALGDDCPAGAWRDRYVEYLLARVGGVRPWWPPLHGVAA
ncbi:MAG: hypothetical protein HY830_11405 [Actinobacteria bacterium]|nr:hypothetical protein [Actinomycetota bacterium]